MARKLQQRDDKHPYESPTTPGLFITFRAYIIELVCLNTNPRIGQRFWTDNKYWGPKFRREVKGIANIAENIDIENKLVQTCLVATIKQLNIKSMSHKNTVQRICRVTMAKLKDMKQQREAMREKEVSEVPDIDAEKNSAFIQSGAKTILSKIKEKENGKT